MHGNGPDLRPENDQHHQSQRRTADRLHGDRHLPFGRIRHRPADHWPGVEKQLEKIRLNTNGSIGGIVSFVTHT